MFRLDQKGISLPLVLAILGIVVANTFYFMNVDEDTKKQNIQRSSEVEENSEKIRLISYLSDSTICNKFFAAQYVPYSASTALKKGTEDFLAPGTLYASNSLKFSSYQIRETNPNAAPLPAPPALEKRYSLYVAYTIMDRKKTPPIATTKTKVLRLPLHIVFEGTPPNAANKIKTCFTDPTNDVDTITEAVKASCLGDGVLLVNSNPPECQHNQPDADCITGNKIFTGVTAGPGGSLTFSCGKPLNAGGGTGTDQCSTIPIKTLLNEIKTGDTFSCKSADNTCATGDLLVMAANGDHKCAKPCTSITLFNKMNPDGSPTCLDKPYTCPAGTFARTIHASGTADCEPYPVLNKSCSAGKFATDLDTSKSNGDAALKCAVYNKAKRCPVPSDETFVQSFATATPSCNYYNN